MKTKINYILLAVSLMIGVGFNSCKDDNDNDGNAKAVLGSSANISFPINDPVPTIITIASDGDWHVEAPEWLTVSPMSGSQGATEVTITASDNVRGGAPDLPRTYTLEFIGSRKTGAFKVLVKQDGDLFRDIQPKTIAEFENINNEDPVELKGLTVVAPMTKGLVATDGTDIVYITGDDVKANKGDAVHVYGVKETSDAKLSLVKSHKFSVEGTGTASIPEAIDITGNLDSYKSTVRKMVKAKGFFDGKNLIVDGMKYSVTAENSDPSLKLANMAGHSITLTGAYSGTATPVVRFLVTGYKDHGANETVYLISDFAGMWSMFADWDNGKGTMDVMGLDNAAGGYLPNITTPKVDGLSPLDILNQKGWRIDGGGNLEGKGTGCNFQKFYLKMGSGSKENMLTFPQIEELGNGVENVKISFDWCPWRDKPAEEGRAYDPTEIVLIVDGHQYTVPNPGCSPGQKLQWYTVEFDLTEKINKNSTIQIRNIDDQFLPNGAVTGNFRYMLNNIKVYKPN